MSVVSYFDNSCAASTEPESVNLLDALFLIFRAESLYNTYPLPAGAAVSPDICLLLNIEAIEQQAQLTVL